MKDEAQNQSKLEQYKKAIKDELKTNNYEKIINEIKKVGKLQDAQLIGKYKKQCGKAILQQMKSRKERRQQSVQDGLQMESCIQICGHLLRVEEQEEHEQNIGSIVSALVRDDYKYTFMLYKNRLHALDEVEDESIIKKVRYLGYLHLFVPKILSSAELLFADFIQVVKELKNIYDNVAAAEQQLVSQHKQEGKRKERQLQQIYIKACLSILNSCQAASNQLNEKCRIYIIISAAVSHNAIILHKSEQIERQLFSFLQMAFNRSVNVANQLSNIPQVFLIILFNSPAYAIFLSSQLLMYAAYRLMLAYFPSTTMGTQVGGSVDKISSFLQQIAIFVCKTLLANDKDIYGNPGQDEKLHIKLIEVYRRLSILCGYISTQNPSQCFSAIKQLFSFQHILCPISCIQIWKQLLVQAQQRQLEYRIFCITKYRKVLIDCKNQMVNNNFQSHHAHSHSPVLIEGCFSVSKQLNVILNTKQALNNTNYVGHVISFASNVLLCIKTYAKKFNNYHAQIHSDQKKQVLAKCKALQTKLTQLIEISTDEAKSNDFQLVLFRCQELANQ